MAEFLRDFLREVTHVGKETAFALWVFAALSQVTAATGVYGVVRGKSGVMLTHAVFAARSAAAVLHAASLEQAVAVGTKVWLNAGESTYTVVFNSQNYSMTPDNVTGPCDIGWSTNEMPYGQYRVDVFPDTSTGEFELTSFRLVLPNLAFK
ncbi:hypothetical protein H0H81_001732 [Sphagnurus paluster]|uniref:Uncharacterized protein n=1 Tax=Sphagnurus paluster TaxID=117069 RepID=A0A9P7K6H4_9AGAR|nr:hypothetical protein H0H81_001732 [Sphagnurus paluster]